MTRSEGEYARDDESAVPIAFQEFDIYRYEVDGNWLEIEYHEDGTFVVDSNLFSEEIVCRSSDELLDVLGYKE